MGSVTFPESWFNHANPYRILMVDPDRRTAQTLSRSLGDTVRLERAATADTALQMVALAPFDLLVLQLRLPLFSGVDLAAKLKRILPDLAVIPVTQEGPEEDASEVVRLGYPPPVRLPEEIDELVRRCREYVISEDWRHRIEWLRMSLARRYNYDRILSTTLEMAEVHERLTRILASKVPVLITGESGTGKELVARLIHATGELSKKPLVVVNCAAVPESLLESLFFGHEKGAFTGAITRSPGKFELAHTGTLFLDEIGEMSPALQSKLLRVIEYGEFERVGGSETLKVDVRLITATNRDLDAEVAAGRFRADLFYRINVFPIALPPLRQRGEDIALLAYHFLFLAGVRNGRQVRYIDPAALQALKAYPWPGNIRELENAVERALLLCGGVRLTPGDFPHVTQWTGQTNADAPQETAVKPESTLLPAMNAAIAPIDIDAFRDPLSKMKTLRETEREAIALALKAFAGNIAQAARALGISRNTLYRKIEEQNLKGPH